MIRVQPYHDTRTHRFPRTIPQAFKEDPRNGIVSTDCKPLFRVDPQPRMALQDKLTIVVCIAGLIAVGLIIRST